MKVGYARVSTEEQHLDLQLSALKSAGCGKIFADHGKSGSSPSRPGLRSALRYMNPGDTLVVWRLDRLSRSMVHLVKVISTLSVRKVDFLSLTEHIDTASSGGRLVFHIMAALAEFERSLISERTRAGMAAARARGRPIGRPKSLSAAECDQARIDIEVNGIPLISVAGRHNIHPKTLRRLINDANTADNRLGDGSLSSQGNLS